jgi:hypothetical protein
MNFLIIVIISSKIDKFPMPNISILMEMMAVID